VTPAPASASIDPIRLYCDEDVDRRLSDALRQRGFDVETAVKAGLLNASDQIQLEYALSQRRALVTHNVRHFPVIHAEWLAADKEHWGVIILVGQGAIGGWLRRFEQVGQQFSGEALRNQMLFVSAVPR
jgi:hypothetical protein